MTGIILVDAVIRTLQRRPELPGLPELQGWRVHGLGDYVPPEKLPTHLDDQPS